MSEFTSLTALKPGTTGVIEARKGKAIILVKGQSLKITNTHGKQVIDFFAFALDLGLRPFPTSNMNFLSMQHTRSGNLRLTPKTGDKLFSNLRKAMFTIEEDTSAGIHDTLIPACDPERYRQLGVQAYHASCAENLQIALDESGYPFPKHLTPAPLNLWMNVMVQDGGALAFVEPVSKEGDCVVLKAEMNCLAVCSACPQDMTPVNGNSQKPSDCHFEIL